MPQVKIDQFVSNEYVATCTSTGTGSFVIACDNDSQHSYGDAQHQDSNPHNDVSVTLPDGALKNMKSGHYYWYNQNGVFFKDTTAGGYYPIKEEADGTKYTWQFIINSENPNIIYYHVYRLRFDFSTTYTEYSGWHALVRGSANPLS